MRKKSSPKFQPQAPFESPPLKPHVNVKIQVVHPETVSPIYANYVEVAHSEYEFSLSMCKLPTKLRPQQLLDVQAGQPLIIEPTVVVELPTRLVKGLIQALETQVDHYEKKYGQLPDSEKKKGGQNDGKSVKKI
jgi:hypothetical protein